MNFLSFSYTFYPLVIPLFLFLSVKIISSILQKNRKQYPLQKKRGYRVFMLETLDFPCFSIFRSVS